MANYEQADARLMDWLAERTDTQLQRLLDAPEDGLTNRWYPIMQGLGGGCRACLAGWAFGLGYESATQMYDEDPGPLRQATRVLDEFGLHAHDDGTLMRRIQGFAAAELLTRRVERPKLPAPVEVMSADPLNSGYREGA